MTQKESSTNVADNPWTLRRVLPWILLIGGIVALIASIGLANEVFQRLKNPNYHSICNLNPILSCTSVADSHQAEAFGLPNYFLGIAGYSAVAVTGATMLAGAKFKRWFWQIVEVGMTFAMGFITWLQFQTIYRIGALCIFCMMIWVATGPLFWYTTVYNLREGNIRAPKRLQKVVDFATAHHGDILLLWFLVIIGLILKRFWYYWSTLI